MKSLSSRPLCKYGMEFVKRSSFEELALIKLCVCAAGMLLGAAAPKKAKKPLVFCSLVAFVASAVPLVTRFFDFVIGGRTEK